MAAQASSALKVASFTVRATMAQSIAWKRAAEAEGHASVGTWVAEALDVYLKARHDPASLSPVLESGTLPGLSGGRHGARADWVDRPPLRLLPRLRSRTDPPRLDPPLYPHLSAVQAPCGDVPDGGPQQELGFRACADLGTVRSRPKIPCRFFSVRAGEPVGLRPPS